MSQNNQPSELEELREKLAAIEHERWADWQKWCHKILRANIKHDIEPTLARWERQIGTPYSKLSRQEQLSDLEQVDRYWPLIIELLSTSQREAEVKVLQALLKRPMRSDGTKANFVTREHIKGRILYLTKEQK